MCTLCVFLFCYSIFCQVDICVKCIALYFFHQHCTLQPRVIFYLVSKTLLLLQFLHDFAAQHCVSSFMMPSQCSSILSLSLSVLYFCFQGLTMMRKKSSQQHQRNSNQLVAANLSLQPQDLSFAAKGHPPTPPQKGLFMATALKASLLPKREQHGRQNPPLGSARLGPEMEPGCGVIGQMPRMCWTSWKRVMPLLAGRVRAWDSGGRGVCSLRVVGR